MISRLLVSLLLCGIALSAADFEDYQAARAVIGQTSFSSRDKGVSAIALSLSKGTLNVADNSGHLFSYDLSRIGTSSTSTCPVCLPSPQATTFQNVFEGIAAVAVSGHNIAIADSKSHRVMVWNNSSVPQPAVILTAFTNPTSVALDNQRLYVGDAGSHHVLIWNQLPTSSSQVPDVTLGVSESSDVSAADTIQSPSAMVSDGVNLYVADSAAHRVLVFSAADSDAPQVLNAASLTAGPLAPGTLISVDHASAATAVLLNGIPLRVTDANGAQLQLQIPYDLGASSAGSIWMQSQAENGPVTFSRASAVRFTAGSPGIFAFGVKEPRTGLILHAPGGVPLSPENPAKPSEILTVWAAGLGAISSEANANGSFDVLTPLHASVNGVPVEVLSASLPADADGIYEVRLRLPDDLSGGASLVLSQNESKSNAVTFPVQ